jgi:hypothetical protein
MHTIIARPRALAGMLLAAAALTFGLAQPHAAQAATTEARLSGLLVERVYLTGATVQAARTDGRGSAEFRAWRRNLIRNSGALSKLRGSKAHWLEHMELSLDYGRARVAKDQAAADTAATKLGSWRRRVADSLGVQARRLRPMVGPLLEAIDAVAASRLERFDLLRGAADGMPRVAATLAR